MKRVEDFKTNLLELREKAIKIACKCSGYEEGYVEYVDFNEEAIWVIFSFDVYKLENVETIEVSYVDLLSE